MMDGNDTRKNASLRCRREMHDRAQTCTVSLGEGTGNMVENYQENRSENDGLLTAIWEE